MLVRNTFVVYSQQISQFFEKDDYFDNGALMFMSQNRQVQNLVDQNKENIRKIYVNEEITHVHDDFFFSSRNTTFKTYQYSNGLKRTRER